MLELCEATGNTSPHLSCDLFAYRTMEFSELCSSVATAFRFVVTDFDGDSPLSLKAPDYHVARFVMSRADHFFMFLL